MLDRGMALLEAPFSPLDWAADTVAKQIYADCVDVDKREEIGVRPILNILRSMNRCQPGKRAAGGPAKLCLSEPAWQQFNRLKKS